MFSITEPFSIRLVRGVCFFALLASACGGGRSVQGASSNPGAYSGAAAPVTVHGDVAIDVALVSRANLTATAQSAPGFRSVSGRVVEITTTGKQPVAGAAVWFEAYAPPPGGSRGANAYVPTGQTSDVEIVLP